MSTATVANPTIRIGSAVLIVDGERILLGRRAQEPNRGRWVLPGGKVEFGETHVDAAIREAREELGVEIEVTGLAGAGIYYILGVDQQRMIVYNRARLAGGNLSPASDISEARFFTRDELRSLDITPVVEQVLRDEKWVE